MKYGAIYPSLKGRTVVVTGGGSGIGAGIVEHFAAQGAKVGFLDIKEMESKALAARLIRQKRKVRFEPADLTDIAALRQAIANIQKAFGPITVLVNNAAHDERHKLEDVTPEYFDNRIAVNLRHFFFCVQAVVPDMKQAGGGSIVNITSGSWVVASPGMPVYVAAKSATYGLVRGLARDLGQHNIRINSIAPGWVLTERQLKLWWSPEAEERQMQRQALKRRLTVADMARVVLFYASDESAAITNQNIIADAGEA
ncbi:MAG TPA: SDR family oxidoreductase [Bauldia sp.]|nr:SDR family oxidoreductase [Bauldia sp.]